MSATSRLSAPCRFMRAAYPTLGAEACEEHRHDEATFSLAGALAAVCQQAEPTDEQIGWMLNDAAAIVDDFDPLTRSWSVTELQVSDQPGLAYEFTVNGVRYVVQESDWEPALPVAETTWLTWIDEANA